MFCPLLLSVALAGPTPFEGGVASSVGVGTPLFSAQQNPRPSGNPNRGTGKPSGPPSGGTPEPTTLLLLAGGAVGYGVLRLTRRKQADRGDTGGSDGGKA